jgi:ABC-2 type transport system permease protein
MTSSVIPQLIRKDLRLYRFQIALTIAAGIIALIFMQRGGEVFLVLGSTWYFVAIIILACMVPIWMIVNERKKQTLTFLMSLPVSSVQYTAAKLASTWVMFLVPWLLLLACAFILIATRNIVPHGAIPVMLILALLPVVGFSLILSVAIVAESEAWAMAATVVCNSTYGIAWYLISRTPSLTVNWKAPAAIWDQAVMRMLFAEAGFVVLAMGLAFFLQSRKRDFI